VQALHLGEHRLRACSAWQLAVSSPPLGQSEDQLSLGFVRQDDQPDSHA